MTASAEAAQPRYALIDGEARHRDHPATFRLPPRETRAAAWIGALVKVSVEAGGTGERFWVRIDRIDAGPRFLGTIDNTLQRSASHGLSLGDEIAFGPEHILDFHF